VFTEAGELGVRMEALLRTQSGIHQSIKEGLQVRPRPLGCPLLPTPLGTPHQAALQCMAALADSALGMGGVHSSSQPAAPGPF